MISTMSASGIKPTSEKCVRRFRSGVAVYQGLPPQWFQVGLRKSNRMP